MAASNSNAVDGPRRELWSVPIHPTAPGTSTARGLVSIADVFPDQRVLRARLPSADVDQKQRRRGARIFASSMYGLTGLPLTQLSLVTSPILHRSARLAAGAHHARKAPQRLTLPLRPGSHEAYREPIGIIVSRSLRRGAHRLNSMASYPRALEGPRLRPSALGYSTQVRGITQALSSFPQKTKAYPVNSGASH